jgi:hypothetical protein
LISESPPSRFSENIAIIIIIGIFAAIIIIFIITMYNNNVERELNTWYQNAIILDKTTNGLGSSTCILQGEDGKRYSEYCNKYLVGDKIKLKMIKDYSSEIMELAQ